MDGSCALSKRLCVLIKCMMFIMIIRSEGAFLWTSHELVRSCKCFTTFSERKWWVEACCFDMILLCIFGRESWAKLSGSLNRPWCVSFIALTRTMRIYSQIMIASPTIPFRVIPTGYSDFLLRLISIGFNWHKLRGMVNKRSLVQQLRRQLHFLGVEKFLSLGRPDRPWLTDRHAVKDNLILACSQFFAVHLIWKPPILALFFGFFELQLM